MSAPLDIKLAMQRWLDECDPQIREHVPDASEPVDQVEIVRAIEWVREYVCTLIELGVIERDRQDEKIALELELPLDISSVWPEHLREALGW